MKNRGLMNPKTKSFISRVFDLKKNQILKRNREKKDKLIKDENDFLDKKETKDLKDEIEDQFNEY